MARLNRLRHIAALAVCLIIAPHGMTNDPASPPAAHGEVVLIDFDTLTLPRRVDPRLESLPIPDSIRSLVGHRVQMRVFMIPHAETEELPYFSGSPETRQQYYQRSPGEDCAGEPETRPARYSVPVLLQEGTTVDWKDKRVRQPLLIEGELELLDDPIDIELGPCPFLIKDATYREVEAQEGFGPLWYFGWGC